MDCQILCHLFHQIICFVLRVSRYFVKQSAILAFFLYCFDFNVKKKSCRKSRFLQSTVEYLTEWWTIHFWRSRKIQKNKFLLRDYTEIEVAQVCESLSEFFCVFLGRYIAKKALFLKCSPSIVLALFFYKIISHILSLIMLLISEFQT